MVACVCVRAVTRCCAISTVDVVITIAIVSSVRPSRDHTKCTSRASRDLAVTPVIVAVPFDSARPIRRTKRKGEATASRSAVDDSSNDHIVPNTRRRRRRPPRTRRRRNWIVSLLVLRLLSSLLFTLLSTIYGTYHQPLYATVFPLSFSFFRFLPSFSPICSADLAILPKWK